MTVSNTSEPAALAAGPAPWRRIAEKAIPSGPGRPALDARLPDYRVVILGAGRNVRGSMPTAMVKIDRRGCVLDWLLSAFSPLPGRDVVFVSGFMAHEVMERYRDIRFVHNAQWETTGPARSLSLAPLSAEAFTYVCYSDVVFRPETVRRMEAASSDLVVAVDRRWRVRYDGRSRSELDGAEKVVCDGDRLLDVGKQVSTSDATAEFAGLIRLSGVVASRLENVVASGLFSETDGLPEVLRFLLAHGVAAEVVDVDGEWAELNAPQDLARFVLGTKAESLERLQPLVRCGLIGEMVSFTHQQWSADHADVLQRIGSAFSEAAVIVRSSALGEDGWEQSSAGAYKSIPDVWAADRAALTAAVEEVFRSYDQPLPGNQVLVQEMLRNVTMSGVVMTRTPSLGAPYYVINYDKTTARTDTVTAGQGDSLQTVFLHRGSAPRHGLPAEIHRLMDAVSELEALVGHDSLDIEFACTSDGAVHVLQVRPIAVAHLDQPVDDTRIAEGLRDAVRFFRELQNPPPSLLGRSTQLSVMSDWNPAEIIGTKPGRLAFSLYRYLITDEAWAMQRAEYGYRDVRPCHLLVDILGHPYIDVRATFNSFVPAALPDELASRLVEHYLAYLASHPELHDKVEFDVLFTCLTFDFDQRADRLGDAGFNGRDIDRLREALLDITRRGIARCARDVAALERCAATFDSIRSADLPPLERAFLLLEDARLHGVPLFAHLARAAFVAVSLLRSLAAKGITTDRQTDDFLASLRTVSGELRQDAGAVAAEAMTWETFVGKYGHLRPGTYDITSPHYASEPEAYLRPIVQAAGHGKEAEAPEADPWDGRTRGAIARELDRVNLGVDVAEFERFCRRAIEWREFGKFLFTRNVSAALEALAEFAADHFISREELAPIRIHDLLALRSARAESTGRTLKRLAADGREAAYVTQAVCLPGQVFSEQDLVCFEQLKAEPNFVTRKRVRAPVVCLSSKMSPGMDLSGKIVLSPNADPGFDWIFSRNIAGLLTMYGGANSHMAVRAAEFQLPAATGIGELLYERVAKADVIEVDCSSRQIRVVR